MVRSADNSIPASEALAYRMALKRWRTDHTLTQAAVAKRLEAQAKKLKLERDGNWTQRRVAYVESGSKRVDKVIQAELDALEGFSGYLPEARAAATRRETSSIGALERTSFRHKHRHFLESNDWKHDLLFFNAAQVPAFTEEELRRSWVEYLNQGVNYILFFDLSAFGYVVHQQYSDYRSMIEQTADEAQSRFDRRSTKDGGRPLGSIIVYGYQYKWDMEQWADNENLRRAWLWHAQWANEKRNKPWPIEIKRPFFVDHVLAEPRRLFLGFRHAACATLAYVCKPKFKSSTVPEEVQLEVTETKIPYSTSKGEPAHISLDNYFRDLMIKRYWQFHDWDKGRPKGDPTLQEERAADKKAEGYERP